jgi:serine/threonine protein kinase
MEYGRCSLSQLIKWERKYAINEILTIFSHFLKGCALLEKYQIAQGDHKPDNIILNGVFNQMKIIDFGVSKVLSKDKGLSEEIDYYTGSLYI